MNEFMFVIIFSFVVFIGIALNSWYVYVSKKKHVKGYLEENTSSLYINDQYMEKKSFSKKVLSRMLSYSDDFSDIGERFNFFSESDEISKLLIYANHPLGLTVKRFQGLKIVMLLFGLFFGIVSFIMNLPMSYMLVAVFPVIGFFIPIFWLKQRAKRRQEELSYTLPDFLDMISVNLKAGASLDQALIQVSSYFEGPIREEFNRYDQRIRLGIPREEVYRELIVRTDVPEFEMVIKSLIRGANLGIPVAKTFEVQSGEIRRLRKERIRELASKAAPKVTMITTFVVMPTALLFIGGLVLLNIISDVKDGLF